jgi:cation diffusion facilitator family transporter
MTSPLESKTADAELKRKAALASIFASAVLTLGKLVAGLLSGSLALLSEAGHGLLDTGATILTYYAVRAADKPADDEHHYGHGKIEAIAALAETGLLIVLAVGVLYEAVHRLLAPALGNVDANWLTFAVLLVSIVVDVVRWRSLNAIAKRTKSDALAADALHFSSDFVASILVLIGLVATHYGYVRGDSLAAVGVAIFIAVAGYKLGRRTIDTLVDAAPAGLTERLRQTIEKIPGVVDIEVLKLRPAGPKCSA